jgi:hypothetical protein
MPAAELAAIAAGAAGSLVSIVINLLVVIPVLRWRVGAVERRVEQNTQAVSDLRQTAAINDGPRIERIEWEIRNLRRITEKLSDAVASGAWLDSLEQQRARRAKDT